MHGVIILSLFFHLLSQWVEWKIHCSHSLHLLLLLVINLRFTLLPMRWHTPGLETLSHVLTGLTSGLMRVSLYSLRENVLKNFTVLILREHPPLLETHQHINQWKDMGYGTHIHLFIQILETTSPITLSQLFHTKKVTNSSSSLSNRFSEKHICN